MRATWPDDPMIHDLVYVEPEPPPEQTADACAPDDEYDDADADESYSLEKLLAGCCTPGKPCPNHIDDVIEDWQDAQLDRHLEGV
jgi:hypothetical protein